MDRATLNKYQFLQDMYLTQNMSITMISEKIGMPKSNVRNRLIYLGTKLRSPGEGQRVSGRSGGAMLRGRKRGPMRASQKRRISIARLKWAATNAEGVSLKPSGYYEITRGQNKGRSLHNVIMEARIGRRLRPDEIVHHIDEIKTNNDDNNLALMTKSGHQRHHRFIQELSPATRRRRNSDGKFT
jgi:hypothetical protein